MKETKEESKPEKKKPVQQKVLLIKKPAVKKAPAEKEDTSTSASSPKKVVVRRKKAVPSESSAPSAPAKKKVVIRSSGSPSASAGKPVSPPPPRKPESRENRRPFSGASGTPGRGASRPSSPRPFSSFRRPPGSGGAPSSRPAPGGKKPFGKPGSGPSSSAPRPASSPPAGGGNKKFLKRRKDLYQSQSKRNKISEEVKKFYEYKKKSNAQVINPVPEQIDILETVTVSDLAKKMNIKASELITKLIKMGMMVSINQHIDADIAGIVASEYKCKVNVVSLYEEATIDNNPVGPENKVSRPPVITVMGHVDHGKTSLLDAIRKTDVTAGEHGGITQHIGAYVVQHNNGTMTFLDTPGHAAFTEMRARGAQVTDIVVLVVAANDGIMPQTVEAIRHAREAKVPIIVAVNKMDLPSADMEQTKKQLSEHDLLTEEWGGSTQVVPVSALTGEGIDRLLEVILLEADLLELKADTNCQAEGKIIEAKIEPGRGIMATVLVEKGILKRGDAFVAGVSTGKVRAMFNDRGEEFREAAPATPIEVIGFSDLPGSGDPFQVVKNEKEARQYGQKRQELKKLEQARKKNLLQAGNFMDSMQEEEAQELKIILKGDVQGSVEAIKMSLEKLSTEEIRLNCIHTGAGAITESDIKLAEASRALVIGFHVRPTGRAQKIAEQAKVDVRKHTIIYDVIEDVKALMEGLLAPEKREELIGSAEVREVFKTSRSGLIAGCIVRTGKIQRGSLLRLYRDGEEKFSGKLESLKRFKDDVKEVREGYECGVGISDHQDIVVGDTLEFYEVKEIAKKLS